MRPGERRKNKKFVKIPKGTKTIVFKKGGRKAVCEVCKKSLQGTPKGTVSQKNKLSKTQKRPSILFGGILCNKCRDMVFEEAIKVKLGIKTIEDVSFSIKIEYWRQ